MKGPPLASPLLELRGVSAAYGAIEALRSAELAVGAGEAVCLIGANGAGKTTTLMAVSGIVPIRSGAILWQGRRIDGTPPHEVVRRGIVQVPEGRRIFPRLTVIENLRMGAFVRGDRDHTLERVFHLFPLLKDRARQPGGTLSGGEQQMLAIARALMAHPKLLLLDEPSLGLSPRLVMQIFEILGRILEEGTSLLLVEQNAHAALDLCARGYVLETGRVALHGTSRSLKNDPRVRAAYLGE